MVVEEGYVCPHQGVLCVFRSAVGRVWRAKKCVAISRCVVWWSKRGVSTSRCVVCLQIGRWQSVEGEEEVRGYIQVCCVVGDVRSVCPYQSVLCVFRSASGRVWRAKRWSASSWWTWLTR